MMGILNLTPDSFYGGSRITDTGSLLRTAEQMLKEGAGILDIGGQSTRPGSERIGAETELKRVIAPVEALHKNFPDAFISIDTYYASVAREAVAAGACLVNDISAGTMDPGMTETVAALSVPYVLMHMQGTPDTMHLNPQYENVTKDVLDFFIARVNALRLAGIRDLVIDPGFGFGKTITHNFELLRNLPVFRTLKTPILLGLSRKSMIWKTLGISPEEAMNGSTVLHTIGLVNGASLLRVHDVKAAVEAVRLWQSCYPS